MAKNQIINARRIAWLSDMLTASNISQAELARLLSQDCGYSTDRSRVNKWLKGRQEIRDADVIAIARCLGVVSPVSGTVQIPVIGQVGAGAEVYQFGEGHGPFDYVTGYEGASPTTVAVQVTGDSMYGRADDGSYVFYDKLYDGSPDDLIGKLCVLGVEGGRIFIKVVQKSATPGLYDLHSTNGPPILAQDITWIAKVQWIKMP